MYKTCPNCGTWFKARASKEKFCSMACYRAWRAAQVKDPEKAKRNRRRRLLMRWVREETSWEEYTSKRDQLREEGLI
jgi:hypothetical protein